jgi:hypothetical protein
VETQSDRTTTSIGGPLLQACSQIWRPGANISAHNHSFPHHFGIPRTGILVGDILRDILSQDILRDILSQDILSRDILSRDIPPFYQNFSEPAFGTFCLMLSYTIQLIPDDTSRHLSVFVNEAKILNAGN